MKQYIFQKIKFKDCEARGEFGLRIGMSGANGDAQASLCRNPRAERL